MLPDCLAFALGLALLLRLGLTFALGLLLLGSCCCCCTSP